MLAFIYPLLGVFWTLLLLLAMGIWFYFVIVILSDIFRSDDMSGWGKAGWCLLILVFPLLGVLLYLVVRGDQMSRRAVARSQDRSRELDDYVRHVAGANGATADDLDRLSRLHDTGKLSDEEFEAAKTKLLA